MDDTRNVTQYREEDVDQQIGATATLEEDTERWEDDGENDLANVAAKIKSAMSLDETEACAIGGHRC